MADESELVLQVNKPAAGQMSELRVNSSVDSRILLSLDFEPSEALSELIDDDLVFKFDDHAELVLRDCFAGEDIDYPNFMLVDGSELDGAELYAVLSGSIKLFPEDDGPVAFDMNADYSEASALAVMTETATAPSTGDDSMFVAVSGPGAAPDEDLNVLLHTIISGSGSS